jgi:hypothetical protein
MHLRLGRKLKEASEWLRQLIASEQTLLAKPQGLLRTGEESERERQGGTQQIQQAMMNILRKTVSKKRKRLQTVVEKASAQEHRNFIVNMIYF